MRKNKASSKIEKQKKPKKNSGNNSNREMNRQEVGDYDHSAVYIRNKETGQWEVRNPAGSCGYNYLYRDESGFGSS